MSDATDNRFYREPVPSKEMVSATQECELNNRKDLTCDCFKDEEELWGAACKSYQPWNDGYGQEYCHE